MDLLFYARLEQDGHHIPKEHCRRDPRGRRRNPAGKNAEKSFFIHGCKDALSKRIPKPSEGHGRPRTAKFHDRRIDADRA